MKSVLVAAGFALLLTVNTVSLYALEKVDSRSSNEVSHDSLEFQHAPGFNFIFPDIVLTDQHNQPLPLNELFEKKKNVVFAFFFSHCVSVCTTITLSLKSIQPDLPPDTLIAMISIDPETDTPQLLSTYAKQHQINDPNWYLLTGEKNQIVKLQKSFEVYRGNKMNHTTSLFIKKSNSALITEIKSNFSEIPNILLASQQN